MNFRAFFKSVDESKLQAEKCGVGSVKLDDLAKMIGADVTGQDLLARLNLHDSEWFARANRQFDSVPDLKSLGVGTADRVRLVASQNRADVNLLEPEGSHGGVPFASDSRHIVADLARKIGLREGAEV